MNRYFLFFPFLFLLLISCGQRNSEEYKDFKRFFAEYKVEGAFVLYDLQQDQYILYNPERCNQPFIPASTFKIFNSLVSLETGVIADDKVVIRWNGVER